MGAVGGLLGVGGGASGSGFASPAQANITDPVTAAQLATANTGVQNSLTGQSALLTALQGQNGIGNQSQVYNQQQGIVNGTGPNPAQAMLNQSTGQNVANQAALMAGQRGAGANVGLMARQAGQLGAATQQNAIGQGATLQANQSLNALNQAGTMANTQAANQVGQTNANNAAQQASQNALIGGQQGFNTAAVGSQGSVNAGNVNLANTTMGGQQAGIGGIFNSLGGVSNLFSSSPAAAAPLASTDASGFSGIGSTMMAAGGGLIKGYDEGGPVTGSAFSASQPQSEFGQFLASPTPASPAPSADNSQNNYGYNAAKSSGGGGGGMPMPSLQSLESAGNWVGNALSDTGSWLGDAATNIGGWLGSGASAIGAQAGGAADAVGGAAAADAPAAVAVAAKGGVVPALVSPGEIYLSPEAVQKVRNGADPMHVGEKIGGKPKVGGAKNSYANDTVPKTLQEGGVVVPRSETQSKNPDRNSRAFVESVLAKRKVRG